MSQCANNFKFDITAWEGHYDNRDILLEVISIAMADAKTVSHYKKDGLVMSFFWTDPKMEGVYPLPTQLTRAGVASLVREWLKTCDYPPQPNHDGSNSKGFHVWNEKWGHVDGSPYGVFAVEPAWLWHGK